MIYNKTINGNDTLYHTVYYQLVHRYIIYLLFIQSSIILYKYSDLQEGSSNITMIIKTVTYTLTNLLYRTLFFQVLIYLHS